MSRRRNAPPLALDPLDAARAASLRYVADDGPGIRRRRAGRGFRYLDTAGRAVTNAAVLARIRRLVIPPAWRRVWICPDPTGHIQATGRDARGRKQYRYHERWREIRDASKYAKLSAFARTLPAIRAAVARDLDTKGLTRDKVLATVVRLLETTLIRVGNEAYARDNRSYGLSTLRERHVAVEGASVRFHFRGKSGKEHEVAVNDRRIATIVRAMSELPGHELFKFVDEAGERQSVSSGDVNAYLKAIAGDDYSAKDFRTWAGTVLAACTLGGARATADTPASARRDALVAAVKEVARRLGNTPAVCRTSYIHPAVIDAFERDTLGDVGAPEPPPRAGLSASEEAVLALLERAA